MAKAEYHYIPIDDPTLKGSGFTMFKVPLNGNGKINHKMILWNNKDKSKRTYCHFDRFSIDNSVNSLKEKLIEEQHIDDMATIENLITLFRNECLILKEDEDLIFFKNGNGKQAAAKKSKKKSSQQGEQQQQQQTEAEEQQQRKEKLPLCKDVETWSKTILEKYEALHNTVLNNLPNIWDALEFALSVKTILNIRGITLPFAGIILGPPSSLKTVVIQLLRGHANTFHTHSFSPKAFVSHSTAVKRTALPDIDMLPKIRNKLFLTPELAPIFSARDDDLLQTISILTSVLDGHGYESDTGAQGHRGYNQDIMFTWVGAVVDIPFRVHKLLSQLGAKMYFYRLPKVEHDEDHYFNQKNEDFTNKVQAISQALSEYLEHFETNPSITFESEENEVPKIPLDNTKDEELAHRYIIRLGKLLAPLRAIVPTWETRDTQGSDYAYGMAIVEDPSRAITQLRNITKAHALCKGRNYIKVEDIPMIIRMVFSTCSIERETIFEILIENDGVLSTSQIVESLNTTKPTALRTMTELKATGLVTMRDINPEEYNSEKEIELKPEFNWFLSDQFKELKNIYM